MTLEEFLSKKFPTHSYIEREGWDSLYVRKAPIGVNIQGVFYKVINVFTFANMTATNPGDGLFTALVEHLIAQGWAIHVECVHSVKLQAGLRRRGYYELKTEGAPNFLYNYAGHLEEWHLNSTIFATGK